MNQRTELTVYAKEPRARSLLKRIQHIHDAIARQACDIFASRGFRNVHDRADWLLADSGSLQLVPLESRIVRGD
jgi:hypothetical protein